ncbi:MAG: VOC family protein [Actinobacteria bacterium]|nr:VOC family protein [Actinomycetota bacterium]MBU1493768.1 VOC family protein [Actinomycetota bacterium]
MAVEFQVTFDAHHPPSLAGFWALALQYVIQPPPPGFDSWEAFLDEIEVPAERREDRAAIVDPQGEGPRVFFQKVPEGKTAKNRVHLDVSISGGPQADEPTRRSRIEQHAAVLAGAGAAEVARMEEFGEFWIVMQDPEGNEFCVT